ncbi:hypothetical protein Adeg_1772 [Ammonifex degensii KC4]|uniref:Uncharacterized protein n=1 Tax=Ammonifex degensii (strain DSM 10501 / KC4) TaxID=429009 RepID=C9R982_AMMDK|nr:hypothetical protein [Ammonifex degensii]ACX52861.1 hypothetical protein Adeg_1772 [Ammonifex degensii KC4]
MLYARAITLRNCGRFTVVASDFGSDYRTHTHVTSEALYASLTRGATWRPRLINLRDDSYAFTRDYDVASMPVWFLPGVFVAEGSYRLPAAYLDTSAFNVVHEFYPSTSQSYVFKNDSLEEKDRVYYVPTYGTIQAIKPNQQLITYGLSTRPELLEDFAEGQTFLLGKKRTMFQIVKLSEVVEGSSRQGKCATSWLELYSNYLHYWKLFESFEILAVTLRYVILRGTTQEKVSYVEFAFSDARLCIPDFYLEFLEQEGFLCQ